MVQASTRKTKTPDLPGLKQLRGAGNRVVEEWLGSYVFWSSGPLSPLINDYINDGPVRAITVRM